LFKGMPSPEVATNDLALSPEAKKLKLLFKLHTSKPAKRMSKPAERM